MAAYELRTKALILHPDDDVVIAKAPIPTGTVLDNDGERIERAHAPMMQRLGYRLSSEAIEGEAA